MEEPILYEQIGAVAILTLNRPESLNAFSPAMARLLWATLDRIGADPSVRALVLPGAGRGFCAGADVKRFPGIGSEPDNDWGSPRGMIDLPVRLQALPQPSVCAVNGDAAGGGFGVALASDFRIASETARFGAVQIRRGVMADAGLTYFLPRWLGVEQALRLMLTGRMISAAEALALGLVGEVVAVDRLRDRALEFAAELARGPRLATRLTREAVYRGLDATLEESLDREHEGIRACFQGPDVREGALAFVEKRPPVFH